jgi:hypothetical protein
MWPGAAGLLLLALPVAAQVKLGDLSTDLSASVAVGYTADYGNLTSSDHSWTLGGDANLSGSYHNPNFLSFNADFFLNQSRANSNYQSISDASGLSLTTNIFGGSHFPGSVSYSKTFNSEGNYAVPGLSNYVTHGNSDTFGINWSENLPDEPSLSASFQLGSSKYSVYGTNDEGNNTFHSLNLHSAYNLQGFQMGAYYSKGGGHSVIPEVVAGSEGTETHSSNTAYGFNVSHRLPLQGSASVGLNRSDWGTNYLGTSSNGTIDLLNALAAVHPTSKLSVSVSANYSDNLSGQIIESVVAAGGVSAGIDSNASSNSLDVMGFASYTAAANLQTSAFVERRTQLFLGSDYGVTSYGGGATYSHLLFDGNFNASFNLTANSSDQTGADTLGFSTTENYSNRVLGWKVTGTFGYSQNVQTLLVTYMNSLVQYSGNASHRWGKLNVSMGAGGSRTALTDQEGTTNSSESYDASVGYGSWFTATGSYSNASGQALATGSGLVTVPVTDPALPSSLVSLYGGDSYSFGLSSTPVKKLLLTASYANSNSNTTSDSVTSQNRSTEFNSLIQYQVRKLYFNSGYSRLGQGFSGSGTPSQAISSFYIGVSRWFNFF